MNEKTTLITFFLLLLFCGCLQHVDDSATSTYSTTTVSISSTSTLPPVEGFELHEWGVLAGCPESELYFVTSRPKQLYMVRQPVIYIHSVNKEPFDVVVSFRKGKPIDTYPPAVSDKFTILHWENVQIVDDCNIVRGVKAAGFVPLQEIITTLNDVDADCLQVGGVRERFLFYEGELEFENRVDVDYDLSSMTATLTNNGDYPVYNLILSLSAEGTHAFSPQVYAGIVDKLSPGEERIVHLSDKRLDGSILEGDLMSLGFTESEAKSFAALWADSFFYPANTPGFANLVYRVSEEEYGSMISLKVSPEPEEMVRTLYVLVDLSNVKKTSECSVDADCVPGQCCHPTSCVLKENAPGCSGIGCTMECASGTMDCGCGHCACINGECKVEWTRENRSYC
ncbi:MAG: hypothetical protein U9M95_00315 [Candidatus Altiarchaeota archaeon]|nr:hypothetical protein [Candidatus Altiarchaeota archaeon]